jgi:hypothetical protein
MVLIQHVHAEGLHVYAEDLHVHAEDLHAHAESLHVYHYCLVRAKASAILGGIEKRLDHLGAYEVAVKFV